MFMPKMMYDCLTEKKNIFDKYIMSLELGINM